MKTIFFIYALLFCSFCLAQIPQTDQHLNWKYSISRQKTGGIDTLNIDTVFAKSGNVYLYKNSGGGYVFGTNRINNQSGFSQIAQKQLNTGNLDIVTEVLIWFGYKKAGSGNSSVHISVRGILPNGATGGTLPNGIPVEGPGAILSDVSLLPFTSVDTSSVGLVFTTVPMSNANGIIGNFFIALDFADCYANTDSLGIWADNNGDGFLGAYSKFGNTWYQTNTAYQNNFDVNMAVFAVVEQSSSIREQAFFNGLKMHLYPNPAEDFLQVETQFAEATEMLFTEIIDIHGRIIWQGVSAVGFQAVTLQRSFYIGELAAGMYYLSQYTENSGRITKKFCKE